ncbi:replication-relaxation family protein [Streptomyces sp. NBC_01571]|uniref:replication-relaxation family protein n=1 Tax=Streptomyces sp. NBC_01571 TaxID=2975883 RepID=UPI002256B5DF|nr:replication-relaxation family protein [Streptomyces sp. NBC_01571]MCX4579000.1 replication-relaxation family protein [Streptomyces sp. NBC_01571]
MVKGATPDQIRRLMCPGTKDAATVRGGLKDLEAEKLVISPGSAVRVNDDGVRVTEKLWTLTLAGLDAAAVVLDRPAREMGGTAKAAAASGAKHARAVTDVLDAFLQTPPEPTQPVVRTRAFAPAAPPAEPAPAVRPEGLGPLTAWSTEAVLPVGGTFLSPARGSLRADMVFASPGHEVVPLLFVEVDNGTEGPPVVADKIERYRRFFARRVPSGTGNGREVALWRTGRAPLPARAGGARTRPPARMSEVGQLAREHWRRVAGHRTGRLPAGGAGVHEERRAARHADRRVSRGSAENAWPYVFPSGMGSCPTSRRISGDAAALRPTTRRT